MRFGIGVVLALSVCIGATQASTGVGEAKGGARVNWRPTISLAGLVNMRRRSALLSLLLAVVAAGISADALVAGDAGAETTTSLRGTIALTGSDCACPSNSVQVYLLHLASGKLSQLTRGPISHEAVGWSPDGSRLLVGETGPGRQGLYSMRADGSSERLLTKQVDWSDAQWSPDGHRVAYLANVTPVVRPGVGPGWVAHLYVIKANGTHRRVLAKRVDPREGGFSWAPDGKRIVFFGRCSTPTLSCSEVGGLVTVKTTGKPTMRQIDWVRESEFFYGAYKPTWSPDGSRIAFLGEGPNRAFGLFVMRTDGSHFKRLPVWMPGYVWSPNSSWIAGYSGGGVDSVLHSDGTGKRTWTASRSGITFSPNSARIAYVGSGSGDFYPPSGALYIAKADGSKQIQLLNVPNLYFDNPLWRGGTAKTASG